MSEFDWAYGDRNGMRTRPDRVPRGENHVRAMLTEEEVREIRASRESDRALAAWYGVGKTAIWNARNFVTWKHVKPLTED